MFVIVVGGGKTGSHLARQLIEQGHHVKVIEQRQEIIERLSQELPRDAIIFADGVVDGRERKLLKDLKREAKEVAPALINCWPSAIRGRVIGEWTPPHQLPASRFPYANAAWRWRSSR